MITDSFIQIYYQMMIPLHVLAALLITIAVAHVANNMLRQYFKRTTEKLGIDITRYFVLRRLIISIIQLFGFLYAISLIPGIPSLTSSLLASAGIIAVIISFAAKDPVSNLISGIIIAIFEPFCVGDRIQIGNDFGYIEDITLRATIIRTWTNKRLIIPNSKITNDTIINFNLNDPKKLGFLDIGIGYGADIDKARKIMVEEARNHPDILDACDVNDNHLIPPKDLVKVRLVELDGWQQKMRLYFWAPDHLTSITMTYDLLESIKKRFDLEGIEVPHPYMTIIKR